MNASLRSDLKPFRVPMAADEPRIFAVKVEDDGCCGNCCDDDNDFVISEILLVPDLPSSIENTYGGICCSSDSKPGPMTNIL